MARSKQREQYRSGSVSEVWVDKRDKDGNPVWVDLRDKDGNVVVDEDGVPVKVKARIQKRDHEQRPVWRICVTFDSEKYVDDDGNLRKRQVRVQKTFHGTLAEAREERDKLATQYRNVGSTQAKLTFSKLCEEWADSDDLDCSKKQRKQYMRFLGYCSPYLDEKPLVELSKADISSALAKAVVKPDGSKLAPATAKKIKLLVKRVFEYAVDEKGYLDQCPVVVRRRRRGASSAARVAAATQRRALSAEEAASLCARLDESEAEAYRLFSEKEQRRNDRNASRDTIDTRSQARGLSEISNLLAVRLMLATGMRRGEALGLTWANLDLEKGIVRVAQTLNESMDINLPKTDAGIRNLYIDEHTLDHLRKWKEYYAKGLRQVIVDDKAKQKGYGEAVFCSTRGGWIDPTNCYRWWCSYRKAAGFDGLLLHELRHTQITLLRGNGISKDMVDTRVGHSRGPSSENTYLHEMPANDKEAADVMGRILYDRSNVGGVVLNMELTA